MKDNNDNARRLFNDLCNIKNNHSWARRLNSIVDHLGRSNIRLFFNPQVNYYPTIKNRLRDQFIQDWYQSVISTSKLEYYSQFKKKFEFESYLNKISNNNLGNTLTRFRLGSHNLEIETGRHLNMPRDHKICKLCNQSMIESEYHFLMFCPKYSYLRSTYLNGSSWPSLFRFYNIMSSENYRTVLNTSKFLKEAFIIRSNTLTQ